MTASAPAAATRSMSLREPTPPAAMSANDGRRRSNHIEKLQIWAVLRTVPIDSGDEGTRDPSPDDVRHHRLNRPTFVLPSRTPGTPIANVDGRNNPVRPDGVDEPGHRRRVRYGGRPDDNSLGTRRDRRPPSVHRSNASTDLEGDAGGSQSPPELGVRCAGPSAGKIDHMNEVSPGVRPPPQRSDRIIAVLGHVVVAAPQQTHHPPVQNVDGRNHLRHQPLPPSTDPLRVNMLERYQMGAMA